MVHNSHSSADIPLAEPGKTPARLSRVPRSAGLLVAIAGLLLVPLGFTGISADVAGAARFDTTSGAVAHGASAFSWTVQSSGVTTQLNGVQFVSGTEGFAVGAGATVLHTTDGGAVWTKVGNIPPTTVHGALNLTSVTALPAGLCLGSSSCLWAGSNQGVIFFSSDGGQTFCAQQTSEVSNVTITSLVNQGPNRVRGTTDSGSFLDTTSGSASSCSEVYSGQFGSATQPLNASSIDGSGAIVAGGGGGTLLAGPFAQSLSTGTTADYDGLLSDVGADGTSLIYLAVGAGGTATQVTVPSNGSGVPDYPLATAAQQTTGTTETLRGAVATDTQGTWWAVGDGGTSITTTDYGAHWTPVTTGISANLRSVSVQGSGAWAVGDNGTILSLSTSSSGPATPDGKGYWLVASDGGIFTFGDAAFHGSTGALHLNKPIVGMAATPDGQGYWLVASDGGIFTFGDAAFHGSTGALHLNKPIVGMAATPDGQGYWLVASDGGIFTFGDAAFHGSTGALHLNQPIVGMAATPDGQGYWLVASDGGIFTFGDAAFHGSTGALHLNKPIVGMAATPDGQGYWLVASDGGIFTFGDAAFHGSTGALHLNKPIVGMAATPDGQGYWLVASDGGIFTFGDAAFHGSTGALHLNQPIVGMAAG